MKYILYIMLVYGSPNNSLITMLKGPAFDDLASCKALAATFVAKSNLPVLSFTTDCEGEKQAQQ